MRPAETHAPEPEVALLLARADDEVRRGALGVDPRVRRQAMLRSRGWPASAKASSNSIISGL